MITLEEAKKIALDKGKESKFSVIESCETLHYYVFLPVSKNGELIGNGMSVAVDKDTGKAELKHFSQMMGEMIVAEYE